MFVHLHTHSYYSFCRGANSIEELCAAAEARGMNALALTDTNGLYGLIWFLQIAKETGITPIIGAEVTANSERAVLLAKNKKGYSTLCRTLSARHLHQDFSLIEHLKEDRDDVIILSDSVSLLQALGQNNGTEDLYVELQPANHRRRLLDFSRRMGILPVATNDTYFVDPEGFKLHKLLRAIDCNTTLTRLPEKELASPQAWLKPPAEMQRAFPDCPQAIENTLRIAEQCASNFDLGRLIFAKYRPPDGGDAFEYLKQQCYQGAKHRYGAITEKVRSRLEYELELIREKGFAPYFLIVHDIVKQAPRTCGRGSAAASLVSFCLGITHVDPIAHNLFFERFLNPGRVDPPDIDVDFPWDERDAILEYVFKKYGSDCTAMIANHVTFQPRAAVREVAKVYGLPEVEINQVTKKLPHFWKTSTISDTVNHHPIYRHHQFYHPWPQIISLAERLHGFPRNLSVHCGGVVIAPDSLDHYVPRQPAPKGVNIIHWEKDQAEDAGLVKIDLLGNRSLAVIRDTLAAIKRNYGIEIKYEQLNPLNDPKTLELFKQGDTIGVFYVESPAMRLLQKKSRTGDFEHLVIHSSMIRPAANNFIREYIRRLYGGKYKPLHPLLDDILKETFGIMCYQEDVAKVAMALGGFDAAEADDLRKILSKKRSHKRLEDYREKFYHGAHQRGVASRTIDQIWQMILSFSGYSFCKPHSASYALVSFKSGYLRAHYPAEFMAAVISNQGGYYSTFAYISEARRMGLKVLLPDINKSQKEYTGCQRQLRVGFMQLKGLQSGAIDVILEERKKGLFRSFEDFLRRVDIDPVDTKILIKSGAFDRLGPQHTRPELMWKLIYWLNHHCRKSVRNMSLFEENIPPMPRAADYDALTRLRHECETIGFLISRHPLTLYRNRLTNLDYVPAKNLHRYIGRTVKTIGWLVTGKVVHTKTNDPMEFISFEDTTALYETTFFPKTYAEFCPMLTNDRPYILRGRVEADFGAVTLTVSDVRFL